MSKWISVKDRLPEDNTDYLCYFGDHPLWPSIGIAPWRGERGFYSIEMQRPIPYITHWMKLPLPPSQQEEHVDEKT